MKEIIEIAEHLHIGVHVDATLGIKRVGAHPVGREGILAVVERLAYPVGTVAAQTLEIPQTQFIVWKCLFPGINAALYLGRKRVVAQPAVVYYLGYHGQISGLYAGKGG